MAYPQLLPLAKGMAEFMHNCVSGQPSKFHFEASFVTSLHLHSFVAWEFFLVLLSWEFIYVKLCNLTISK